MRKIVSRLAPLFVLSLFAILMLTVLRASFFDSIDPEKHVYFEIVFLLLIAVAGELAVAYVKQPTVMILMVLGMLLSHSFLDAAWGFLLSVPLSLPPEPPEIFRLDEVIHVFAQLGGIILLFKVGLHNKIEGIFSKDNLLVAMAGVLIPFAAGYAYAVIEGGNFAYSMFLGAALTATSVGVTVAILKELGKMEERFAKVIIGAAIIDDVLGLLVLSFVINLTGGDGSLAPIAFTLVSAFIFILGSIMAGDYFIRYLD
ncbi:MAG: cation:proton antiporter, partial [Candidatus Micrarchaeota archaeon]